MTEKRFIPIFDGTDKRVVGAKDNGKIISFMDMFDLLNDLSDENEQLRKENDMLSCELSVSANKEISRNCRIAELEEENEQLKQKIKKLEAQLYKVEDGVCDICNNMYLVQQGRYFVSKCKKGHDECSKMDLDYCDDFELKDGDV